MLYISWVIKCLIVPQRVLYMSKFFCQFVIFMDWH